MHVKPTRLIEPHRLGRTRGPMIAIVECAEMRAAFKHSAWYRDAGLTKNLVRELSSRPPLRRADCPDTLSVRTCEHYAGRERGLTITKMCYSNNAGLFDLAA